MNPAAREIAIQRALYPNLPEHAGNTYVNGEIFVGVCDAWVAIRFGNVQGQANTLVVLPPEAAGCLTYLLNSVHFSEWSGKPKL